jgi:hypothetical protein
LKLSVHLIIPKSHDSIAVLFKKSRPQTVFALLFLLGVLTAVEFDNKMPRDAAEIGEVGTNPVLSTEFEPNETFGSEAPP